MEPSRVRGPTAGLRSITRTCHWAPNGLQAVFSSLSHSEGVGISGTGCPLAWSNTPRARGPSSTASQH